MGVGTRGGYLGFNRGVYKGLLRPPWSWAESFSIDWSVHMVCTPHPRKTYITLHHRSEYRQVLDSKFTVCRVKVLLLRLETI